jgi:hypothetical protein
VAGCADQDFGVVFFAVSEMQKLGALLDDTAESGPVDSEPANELFLSGTCVGEDDDPPRQVPGTLYLFFADVSGLVRR